jgi:hypothetical protein
VWSPSSLIFLVLLGVWAAYFLQYWIRRRDHLATARSVEQFSDAMRVLEQRDRTPRTDLSEPSPRSWNVHPARQARPQVLVKRAVPAGPTAPVVTERVDEPTSAPTPNRPAARTGRPADRPRQRRRAQAASLPARVRPGRRVRAVLMLVALVELVVIATLVPLGMLPVWALAPGFVALVFSVAYVRAGVRAEQALRAARRRRADRARRRAAPAPSQGSGERRQAGRAAPSPTADRDPGPRSTPVPATSRPAHEATGSEGAAAADAPTDEPASSTVGPRPDVAAGAEDAAPEAHGDAGPGPATMEYVHLVDEDDIPLTWDPVPVPRPTYTMKARAERPEVPQAEVTPDPGPVALPPEEGLEDRRVAGA